MPIKRFFIKSTDDLVEAPNGRYVLYDDHLAEISSLRAYATKKITAMTAIVTSIVTAQRAQKNVAVSSLQRVKSMLNLEGQQKQG
jgi:hypothetical protein